MVLEGIHILVGWDQRVWDVEVLHTSSQVIVCCYLVRQGVRSHVVAFVYAVNKFVGRRVIWRDIARVRERVGGPWCVLGNFNAIRFLTERSGGSSLWPQYMNELDESIRANGLYDLRSRGLFFTWRTGNPGRPIQRKLDRVLIDDGWQRAFPESEAEFISHSVSDHTLMIVTIGEEARTVPKPFKFFNYWIDVPGFQDTVSTGLGKGGRGVLYVFFGDQAEEVKIGSKRVDWAIQEDQA